MGAGQVGVGVDHFRFDPQAELHPERADMVDQRAQAAGPDGFIDVPVAEPGTVVAAVTEPAVVQDEAFRTDLRAEVGEVGELVEVVVEVDGFPGVEHHRAGPGRMSGAGAEVVVEAGGQSVQALVAVAAVEPRAGVLLAGAEDHLAGKQQFAGGEGRAAGGQSFGQDPVVAAPGDVQAPHLPVAEAEARCAGRQDQGGVGAGAPAAGLAQPGAGMERMALRGAFTAPAAGEVEQFGGGIGDRQREHQTVERVRQYGVVVAYGGSHPHQPGGGEPGFQDETEAGGPVGGPDPYRGALGLHRVGGEQRGPVGALAVPGQTGLSGPSGAVLGQQRDPWYDVVESPHVRHGDGVGQL